MSRWFPWLNYRARQFSSVLELPDDMGTFVCCQFGKHGDGQGFSAESDRIGVCSLRFGIPAAIARHRWQCIGVVHRGLNTCLLQFVSQSVPFGVLHHIEVVDGCAVLWSSREGEA